MDKYQDLKIELERIWHEKTSVTPIVISTLGADSKKFTLYVDLLNLQDLKYFHLLGTASILRLVLQLSGTG